MAQFKIGSLIKAYHSGIHEVTGFHDEPYRGLPNLLIDYKQKYTNDGKRHYGQKFCCHDGYCTLIDAEWIEREVEIHEQAIANLRNLKWDSND
jgi:hypothetical protein